MSRYAPGYSGPMTAGGVPPGLKRSLGKQLGFNRKPSKAVPGTGLDRRKTTR